MMTLNSRLMVRPFRVVPFYNSFGSNGSVGLTLRLSCGARAPQRFRPRPPARRLLQPVARPPVPEGQLFAIVNCSLDLVTTCTFGLPHRARLRTHRFLAHE